MKSFKLPFVLVNFKSYSESIGKNAYQLAKVCERISREYSVNISVAPQFTDIYPIANSFDVPIFAQHADPVVSDAKTGHVSILAIKEAGAIGTLLNHSERKLKMETIKKCIEIAKEHDMITICCSDSIDESLDIINYFPNFIAYEPPELIGTGVSVSQVQPEIIEDIVESVGHISSQTKIMCGAGISSAEDIDKALKARTVGVLISSAVVKAKEPQKILESFAKVLNEHNI